MKKHTWLRLLLLLLSCLLALSFLACGENTPDVPDTPITPDDPVKPGDRMTTVIYIGIDGYDGPTSFRTTDGLVLGTPTLDGADFLGWYDNAAFEGEPVTAIAPGTEGPVTLYAKLDVYTLTVNFRYGVEGREDLRRKISFGESVTLPTPDFTYTGHTFAGWNIGGEILPAGAVYTFDDASVMTVNARAEWTVNSYRVSYVADGEEISSGDEPFGAAVTKTAPAKEGYDFLGWARTADAMAAEDDLTVPAGDVTFYAVYKIKNFALEVVGGVPSLGLASGTYDWGTDFTLPASVRGYTLTYTVTVNGETSPVADTFRLTAAATLTVTATPVKVSLRLSGDKFTGTTVLSVDYGALLIDVLPHGTADGTDVAGWYYDSDRTLPVGVNDRVSETEETTLYAKADGTLHAYVLHRADGTTERVELPFGATLTVTDRKVGYEFLGWKTADGTSVSVMGSADADLYADFRIGVYKITFDTDGGIGLTLSPLELTYGETLTLPDGEDMYRIYRTFGGWEYQGTVYASLAEITVGEGDAVIRAVWNKISIRVIFYDWDKTPIYTLTDVYAGEPVSIAGNSVIEGVVEFDRWIYTDMNGTGRVFENGKTVFETDTDLRAVYCKTVAGVKTDLVYPDKSSFAFIPSSYVTVNGVSVPNRYEISAHYVDQDGYLTGDYIAVLPYDLCIPSTYNGKIVGGIYSKMPSGSGELNGAFCTLVNTQKNSVRFNTVYVPAAFTSIPNYAFYGQSADITFGAGSRCTNIAYKAFCYSSYTSGGARNFYNFPANVRYIGTYAFSFNIANSGSMWYWYDDSGERITTLPSSVTYVGKCAFTNIGLFEEVYIGEHMTGIGEEAFYGMHTLKRLTIADTSVLKVIPKACFRNCRGLTEISIPSGVETIGEEAFFGCENITKVTFSNAGNLREIGKWAFYRCSLIEELHIPEGVEVIGPAAFGWYTITAGSDFGVYNEKVQYTLGALKVLTLPSTLREIGECAFAYQSISSLTLPASIEVIGDGAFKVCPGITSVDLSGLTNLRVIGRYAFMRSYGEKVRGKFDLVIPASVTEIGANAFACFGNIRSLTFLGTSLETIGTGAFAGIEGLRDYDLVLPEGLKTIGSSAFVYTEVKSVKFPATLETLGSSAFYANSKLKRVAFTENPALEAGLFLGTRVFGSCTALETVTFPSQLRQLSGGGSTMGYNGVFAGCTGLVSVYFNGRTDGVADRELLMATSTFYGCTALTDVYIRRNRAVSIQLFAVDRETELNHMLFEGCVKVPNVHVLPALKSEYDKGSWAGLFRTTKRAVLMTDVES